MKELELAYHLKKHLFLAYEKKGVGLRLYPIALNKLAEGRVLGMSGCSVTNLDQAIGRVINTYPLF